MRLLPGEAVTRAMTPTGWLLVILGEVVTRGSSDSSYDPNCWLLVILGEVVTRGSSDSSYDPNWLAACDSW